MFENLVEILKANPRKIVYTEGPDPRILASAARLKKEGFLTPVLVGKVDEVKAVLVRMKQKEDAFWTCKQSRVGTFTVALLLDGFRTDIEIAIGEYPRPKGKAANTREAK